VLKIVILTIVKICVVKNVIEKTELIHLGKSL